jgi:hypothetical protein
MYRALLSPALPGALRRAKQVGCTIMEHAAIDYDRTPFVLIWETTQACDLTRRHRRAAQPDHHPGEGIAKPKICSAKPPSSARRFLY